MKRLHTIEVTGRGTSEIVWVDEYGHEGKMNSTESARFQEEHPRSVYIPPKEFYKFLGKVREERSKLAAWKEWAV